MVFKRHPKHTILVIREDGKQAKYFGEICEPFTFDPKPKHSIMGFYIYGTVYSWAKLVLETWGGPPPEGKRHYAIPKDGDFRNTHPDNLEWRTSNYKATVTGEAPNSKLTLEDSFDCHRRYTKGLNTLKSLAIEYNVSDMSIHRAVKRITKFIESQKS